MGLYEKIKDLADNQKLSMRRLEEILGYGNGTIRRWEKQTPGVDKIQKVANYFNVSIDYLLGRTDNPDGITPEDMKGFFRMDSSISNFPEEKQEKIMEQMEEYQRFLIETARNEAAKRNNGNNN